MSTRLYRFQTKRPGDDISQWLAFIWEVGEVAKERGVDNPFLHAPVHVEGRNFKEVYPDAQVIHPMEGSDEGVRTQCEHCGIDLDEDGNDVGEGTELVLFTAIKCPICENGRYHVSESERTIPVAGWLAHLDEHFQ